MPGTSSPLPSPRRLARRPPEADLFSALLFFEGEPDPGHCVSSSWEKGTVYVGCGSACTRCSPAPLGVPRAPPTARPMSDSGPKTRASRDPRSVGLVTTNRETPGLLSTAQPERRVEDLSSPLGEEEPTRPAPGLDWSLCCALCSRCLSMCRCSQGSRRDRGQREACGSKRVSMEVSIRWRISQ
jgi:hypothetical protein